MIWHQIISLKTGTTINYLEFPEDSCKIIEAYDLHGLEITATSLTWAPYLKIDGCNEVGLHCLRNEGYMIDIMDHLGAQYNFTYLSQKNVDNDWGMMPVNGTWIGVWGDIIRNEHDMTLGPWYNTFERNYFFDFVPLIQTRDILAMKPQHSKIDFGLFTRVFVGDTLFYISSMAGITCCLTYFISKICLGGTWNGLDIITFIGWLFFTLVNSYYCGVLTMFFATPISLPFDNIRGAIQAHPTWNLMFAEGYEGWIRIMAENDQDFKSLWLRYQMVKTETTFDTVKNGG